MSPCWCWRRLDWLCGGRDSKFCCRKATDKQNGVKSFCDTMWSFVCLQGSNHIWTVQVFLYLGWGHRSWSGFKMWSIWVGPIPCFVIVVNVLLFFARCYRIADCLLFGRKSHCRFRCRHSMLGWFDSYSLIIIIVSLANIIIYTSLWPRPQAGPPRSQSRSFGLLAQRGKRRLQCVPWWLVCDCDSR